MPELRPFVALRYSSSAGDPSALLAPPYDVINEAAARELRNLSPHNCVHLILPEGESPGRYERAARLLDAWRREGILQEDSEPAVYAYRQRFELGAARHERRAILAALRLSPFGQGEVLPHEETHSAPKQDRLRLTLACRAQLSPIFLIARDPSGRLRDSVSQGESGRRVLSGRTPDGVVHDLWRLPAGGLGECLCHAAGEGPLLIADGHHRYETALEVRRRLGHRERASSVLTCVVGEGDPGLLIHPTHRTLRHAPEGGEWERLLGSAFDLEPLVASSPEAAAAAAHEVAGAMVFLQPGRGRAWLLRPKGDATPPTETNRACPGEEAVARIPSVIFERLVLDPLFALDADRAQRQGLLSYHRDPDSAVAHAGADGGVFLLAPVALEDVWRAAEAGRRLPPKTTYFAPKIPSGLLFRPL
ncbi:MAG: DUF1015 family protein [Gemmatimonadota bacterium]